MSSNGADEERAAVIEDNRTLPRQVVVHRHHGVGEPSVHHTLIKPAIRVALHEELRPCRCVRVCVNAHVVIHLYSFLTATML